MAKISIIIPCYNVEKYIDRCIQSVVDQTIGIENLEIILVNDASTDGTLKKITSWENQYPNSIMVITYSENQKQGAARNIGLSYATAEYVGFVDADDWIDTEMYLELYHKIKEKDYDLVRCKFVREHEIQEKQINIFPREDKIYEFENVNGHYWGEVSEVGNNGEFGSICCCLFKRNMIIQNNIFFPEKIAYEDNYWFSLMNLYISNLYIVDQVYYHYYINENSTVMTVNSLQVIDRLDIEMMKLSEYKRRQVFDDFYLRIESDFVRYYFLNTWFLFFSRYTDIPEGFNDMKKIVNSNFPKWDKNPYLKCNSVREIKLLKMLQDDHFYTEEELEKFRRENHYLG